MARTTQKRLEELYNTSPESVLRIVQKATGKDRGGFSHVVYAPLPDGYGMSVGSSFTDPQNIDLASQSGSGTTGQFISRSLRLAGQATGFSTKAAVRSNVFYAGPEPTEISFEVNFNSYYSAKDEVVIPAAKLMMMSVGREYNLAEINENVVKALRALNADVDDEDGITRQFGLIRSSGWCMVDFGKTMHIPRVYISSVGVKFSNILDNEGYPESADCSVTMKVIRNPTQVEVGRNYFKGIVR